ncbi:MAG: hypothetical protein JSW52_10270 [Candidatus Coatesbacteria bacterium]|nr:MAG: hypothetical protein JSW52_10270 [Candidatus Coatesbacteria bacterium]
MRSFIVISALILITALLLTAVTAEATGEPTIFAIKGSHFYVFRLPYPLPIDDFDLPWGYVGLAYDGDYWWIVDFYDTLYQFDYGGDFVSSFTTPPSPRGLGFDGEYLWISCKEGEYGNVRVYQCELDGTPGPMGDFPAVGHAGLTFFQGKVLTLTWDSYVNFYTPDGTFIRELDVLPYDSSHPRTHAITNDGTYLWISICWVNPTYAAIYKIDPETGELAGTLWGGGKLYCGLSYAEWTYTEVEAESIGKIKAFFE